MDGSSANCRPVEPVVETILRLWLKWSAVVLVTMIGAALALADAPRATEAESRVHGIPMVSIPDGMFMMGSVEGRGRNQPPHQVFVDAFYMDQFEVTVTRYATFLHAAGANRQDLVPKLWDQVNPVLDGLRPVIGVSWHAADLYCRWDKKRLPTEAEWEKAARGTDQRMYPWGNTEPSLEVANYAQATSNNIYLNGLKPVGSYQSGKSPYGIYDMAGNASEWVSDWYDESYYAVSPKQNPHGPNRGVEKVIRGGSFLDSSLSLRSVSRRMSLPDDKGYLAGIRCARDAF